MLQPDPAGGDILVQEEEHKGDLIDALAGI
jgi:hypothetical protein